MTGLLASLSLITALLIQAREAPQLVPVTVAQHGDNVTLKCSISGEKIGLFYWYKLNFVSLIQTVAAGSFDKISLKGDFDNSRFKVTKAGLDYLLNIKNVSKDDEGTYFCQAGSAYTMTIRNGTGLAVNDKTNQRMSVYVKQSPEATLMEPGDSVNIQCSLLTRSTENGARCPAGHSVYWFRSASGGLNSSIIYIHKSRSHEQKSCVFTFSKTIRDSSDAGTYYCAVVTCGEILFGEGTTVDTKQRDPVIIILGTLLVLCVTVIAVLVVSRD